MEAWHMVEGRILRTADVGDANPHYRPRAPRKNLFLSASVQSDRRSVAVRIRNLSETGALIEASALPDVGDQLRLHRCDIAIGCVAIWRSGNRCGVQFDARVPVDYWITGQIGPANFRNDQSSVDDAQRRLRDGEEVADPPVSKTMPVHGWTLNVRIADELGYVGRLLAAVGDRFADDPIMLHRHSMALQNFDAACQILQHLQEVLAADDKIAAIERVTMADMRSRLARKPLF
jgi:hypothetical protein